ncbi:MAG TPA: protein kinase [Acidobacteriota bacterium]
MIGRSLGHYQIVAALGAGGMGEVYRAEDTRLGREVALKVLPAEFAADAARLARFEQEARAVAALNHPNIVVLYSIEEARPEAAGGPETLGGRGEGEGKATREQEGKGRREGEGPLHFLTMELVEGTPLSAVIPCGGLALAHLFELAVPLADALAAAHERGILHRDLKPANVMVSREGRVKVLDFGLAKLRVETVAGAGATADASPTEAPTVGPSAAEPLTEEGKILGTVAYMSPEQAEGKVLDARSDIFSLGVLLYEMATGERPFEGETKVSVLSSIIKDTPRPVTELNPNLPRHLGRIVKRCLEKDPRRRYQTTADLRNDLGELQREVESGELAPVSAQGGAAPSAAPSPLVRLAWGVTAVVAIALLALLATLLLSGRRDLQITPQATRPISRDPGLEIHPAISPDGTMVAYAAGSLGRLRIYVRQIAPGPEVQAIPLTEGFPGDHRWPRWSPDGERILFTSQGATYVVPALGGTGPAPLVEGTPLGAAWAPDGERLAFVSRGQPFGGLAGESTTERIYTRNLVDGETEAIAEAAEPHSLSWSPDGEWIGYVSGNAETFNTAYALNIAPSSIWLVPASGGDPVPVIDDGTRNVSPAWLPDSRHVLFVSNKDGARDVYVVPIGGTGTPAGPPRRLTTGLDVHTLTVSADGARLAYSRLAYSANVWSIRIPRDGNPVSVSAAVPVTTGNQTVEGIGVSSDGQWLAFDSDQGEGGNSDIYRVAISGGRPQGRPQRLTSHPSGDFLPSWSPDGQEIVFHSFRNDGQRDLYVMPASGGGERRVTSSLAQELYADWSPDGNRLVFRSWGFDDSGREEIWTVSRPGRDAPWGEPVQLTFDGGGNARWSPDGLWIARAGQSRGARGLWLVPAEGGAPRQVVDESFGLTAGFADWSPDGQTVYFKGRGADGAGRFWAVPVGGGEPRVLVEFDDPARPSPRSEFATDGEHLFFVIADQQSDVWVMELRRQ